MKKSIASIRLPIANSWFSKACVVLAIGLAVGFSCGPCSGQDQPTTDSSEKPLELGTLGTVPKLPDIGTPPEGGVMPEIPPEIQAEADAAKEKFDELHDQLADLMGDLRETHIRYHNDEDRSPEALELFRSQRQAARRLMLKLFDAALAKIRILPDDECAIYLITFIEYRMDKDFYDEAMMEAGARLIDLGVARYERNQFLYIATARAAIVAGDFGLARRLFKVLQVDKLNKTDQMLVATVDVLEKQWNLEQELLAKDIDNDVENPRIKMVTTQGEVTLELFINEAPSTVSNFIQLVEKGYYDGLDFYQVVDNLLALTGDETGTGQGTNNNKFLVDEHANPNARQPLAGSLVMAKRPAGKGDFVPHSASAQWAITYLPLPNIGDQQTIFGRVVDGMDAIGALYRIDPSDKQDKKKILLPPDRILSMKVLNRPKELPAVKYVDADSHAGHNHPPGMAH